MILASSLPPRTDSGRWVPIPLLRKDQAQRGMIGGEGGQWPRSLAIDARGEMLYLGIDVGGIFRRPIAQSGSAFEPANVGYSPRGAAALAVDPANPARVLAIGGNTHPGDHHGVYLSENRGASWKHVFPVRMGGIDEMREQLAFDPTTADRTNPKQPFTRRAYWSRVADDKTTWGEPPKHPALYISQNGGKTWIELPNSAPFGGSILRHHPRKPWLYLANERGVFRTKNAGKSFERLYAGNVTGIDLLRESQINIVISTEKGVFVANENGTNWQPVATPPLGENYLLRNVKASPADPSRWVLWRDQYRNEWNWQRFVTHDRGRTWQPIRLETEAAFLPVNARQGIFAWHPTDPNQLWSIGGDIVTQSHDGGKTLRWDNAGNHALLIGGKFSFNAQNPDLLFFGSQDYNGAVTRNRGRWFDYQNPTGNGWGGFTYGGYAINPQTFVVGSAAGWGAPRRLTITTDGGKTWRETGQTLAGLDTAIGHPTQPSVAFVANFRTEDAGQTWAEMPDCHGVLATAPDGTLFGVRRGTETQGVVVSGDAGRTWNQLAEHRGDIRDLAYDAKRQRLYAVLNDEAAYLDAGQWRILATPRNQFGGASIRTIAVDPINPDWVYIGSAGHLYASSVSVCLSTDTGTSWRVLTRRTPLGAPGAEKDGGREAECIRVHPRTREAWVSTSCYGIWKWVTHTN
jgi:photosystem II stability/assembly factor-like uncharacterized protein